MTTTGYGDLTPVEPVGKFFGALSMISGIMVVALPISILGSKPFLQFASKVKLGR